MPGDQEPAADLTVDDLKAARREAFRRNKPDLAGKLKSYCKSSAWERTAPEGRRLAAHLVAAVHA